MGIRDISIRKLRTEDSKAVAKIICESLTAVNNNENAEITPKYVLSLSNKRKMFVAMYENKIVGTASIEHDTIYTLFADEQYRNQGVEEALIILMEEIAANNGFRLIKLEARRTVERLYQRLGYSMTDERYQNELGECVIMEKYLE